MSVRTVGAIAVKLNAITSGFGRDFNKSIAIVRRFGRKMDQVGASVTRIGRRMSLALTAPLVGIGGLAIREFSQFGAAMRNVNVIARQSEKQFAATSDAALKLVQEFGRKPVDLAKALYNINSASFKAAEGLKVLEASARAGRAGVTETAVAAKAITGVLNAYGKSADAAEDVSDILFKTVEKGVLTFGELSEHLGATLASASAAKVSFDEVAAGIATMTRAGIGAPEAFTSMNRALLRIVQGTSAMDKVFQAAGRESARLTLEQEGLGKTMEILSKATGGSAKGLLDLGFRLRSLKAAIVLTSRGSESFKQDLAEIADKNARAGATTEAFEEQMKSLQVQMDRLRSSLAVLRIKATELFVGDIRQFVDKLQLLTKRLHEMAPETKKMIVIGAAIVAAIGPVLVTVGLLISSLGTVIGLVTSLTGLLGAALVAAIAAVTYEFVVANAKGETFGEKVGSVVKALLLKLVDLKYVMKEIGLFFEIWHHNNMAAFTDTKNFFVRTYAFIRDHLSNFFLWLGVVAKNATYNVGELLGKAAWNMQQQFSIAGKNIGIVLQNLVDNAKSVGTAVKNFIANPLKGFKPIELKNLTEGVIGSPAKVKAELKNLMEGYKGLQIDPFDFSTTALRDVDKEFVQLEMKRLEERQSIMAKNLSKGVKAAAEEATKGAAKVAQTLGVGGEDIAAKVSVTPSKFAAAVEKGSVEAVHAELKQASTMNKIEQNTEKSSDSLSNLVRLQKDLARGLGLEQPEVVEIAG